MRRDEASLLTVEGVPDAESDQSDVVVVGQVWRFYAISKEYSILPFLEPKLRSVHRGWHHQEPLPHLPSASEAVDCRWLESL